MIPKMTLDQPGRYRICAQGRLAEKWADFFEGLAITYQVGADGHVITELSGELPDQAAVQGVLQKLYNLGLPLLLVEHLGAGPPGGE